jgi:hypothetical protein
MSRPWLPGITFSHCSKPRSPTFEMAVFYYLIPPKFWNFKALH